MGPGVAVTCKFPRETMRSNWRYMKSKFPRSRNYVRDSKGTPNSGTPPTSASHTTVGDIIPKRTVSTWSHIFLESYAPHSVETLFGGYPTSSTSASSPCQHPKEDVEIQVWYVEQTPMDAGQCWSLVLDLYGFVELANKHSRFPVAY